MFIPSNMLLNYLSAQPRDMFDIVGALMGYINADPTFKTNDFEQAVQYVLSHGINKEELFAQFDSEIDFEENPAKWTEEYYSYARVYLKDNFCEKRIAHVKAIAKKLYPTPISAAPVRPSVQNVNRNNAGTVPKKAQSQQRSARKEPMPVWIKIGSAIVVIILLALIIKTILM